MFSLTSMPSTTSVLSTYTSFAASAMLLRTVISEVQTMTTQLIPQQLQEKLFSKLGGLFGNNFSSQITLIIDEHNGLSINEIYQASDIDLSTIITPSVKHLKVSKAPRDKNLSITIDKGEKITDVFEGIRLIWEFVSIEKQKSYYESDYESSFPSTETSEQRSIHLSFHKKYKEIVLSTYLPYVVDRSKVIKEENKVLKLYSLGNSCQDVNLDHPSTFDTLAMDSKLKKELMDDLNRFLNRRVFYRRVGKAWKRGYLLYGPPGTGKSSLIAAMANYMKFDIYDLELSNLHSNADLRRLIASTANRSILVIEDIDCTIELQDRQYGGYNQTDNQLTLSGLLNFIDGLWTSCGDERIIVFTTNHKDRLDPALLRPGRMDMHIHMSYCTPSGFKILASNYLRIEGHCLFTEIEGLIKEVEVTPAEVAEELMKSEDPDIALAGLVAFLQQKKKQMKCSEESKSEVEKVNEQSKQSLRKKKVKESKLEVVKEGKRKKARSGKSRR